MLYGPPSLPGGDGIVPGYARPPDGGEAIPAEGHQPEGAIMPLYECVLIARNDVTQQQVEGVADQYRHPASKPRAAR